MAVHPGRFRDCEFIGGPFDGEQLRICADCAAQDGRKFRVPMAPAAPATFLQRLLGRVPPARVATYRFVMGDPARFIFEGITRG